MLKTGASGVDMEVDEGDGGGSSGEDVADARAPHVS